MSRELLRKRGHDIAARLRQPITGVAVPGLDDFIAEVVYGGIWDRPNLGLAAARSAHFAVLSVLQRLAPLKPMVGTALDLGLTPRNLLEVFVQVGLYAGFVTTDMSAGIAHEVFAARGLTVPPEPPRADSNEMLDLKGREVMEELHGERPRKAMQRQVTQSRASSTLRLSAMVTASSGLAQASTIDSACCVPSPRSRPSGLESQLRKFSMRPQCRP